MPIVGGESLEQIDKIIHEMLFVGIILMIDFIPDLVLDLQTHK